MLDKFDLFNCDLFGKCFMLCNKKNIDADDLFQKVMTSQWGKSTLNGNRFQEWCCDTFMFEGFVKYLEPKNSPPKYDDFVLWFTGFLYKYWYETHKTKPEDILSLAPVSLINKRFDFYHTQSWDYIIEDLMGRQSLEKQ